ncbi:glycoside hydrolase 100 family protein [Staphylococcus chromogenes]|nr:glycoside hydrolase 100 family protein [Staphylococcus chromogenes]
MNIELANLKADLEVLKQKYDFLLSTHAWFGEGMYEYEENPSTKNELMVYAYGYKQAHIQHKQTLDLMCYYLKEFEELIKRLNEIEKASSENFGEESLNA